MTARDNLDKWLTRAVWITAGLVVVAVVAFGTYYYFDRYRHENVSIIDEQMKAMEEAVKADPQNVELRVSVALAYFRKGYYDQAIAQCTEALKLEAEHEGALFLLGSSYMENGDLDEAIPPFEKIVELNEGREMAMLSKQLQTTHYNLGVIYLRKQDYDQAIASLDQALVIDRTDADARYSLGVAYQSKGDCQSAIREFHEALRFVPNFLEVYQGLQGCYESQGETDKAAYAAAMVDYCLGDYEKATASLEEVVDRLPEFGDAWFGLGLSYERLGRNEEARVALEKALSYKPDDFAVQMALGRVKQAQ